MTPWTAARWAPLSVGPSRREHWGAWLSRQALYCLHQQGRLPCKEVPHHLRPLRPEGQRLLRDAANRLSVASAILPATGMPLFCALRRLSPPVHCIQSGPPPRHPSAHKTVIRITLRFTWLMRVWESWVHFFAKLTTGTSRAPKLFSGCLWLSASVYNFSLILEVFRNVDYILYAEHHKGWINWFIKTTLFYSYNESESEVSQLCPTLWDITNCNLPGSSIHGTFQARVLVWVVISFSRGSSQPRDRTWVSCVAGRCFTIWVTRGARVIINTLKLSFSASLLSQPKDLNVWLQSIISASSETISLPPSLVNAPRT